MSITQTQLNANYINDTDPETHLLKQTDDTKQTNDCPENFTSSQQSGTG